MDRHCKVGGNGTNKRRIMHRRQGDVHFQSMQAIQTMHHRHLFQSDPVKCFYCSDVVSQRGTRKLRQCTEFGERVIPKRRRLRRPCFAHGRGAYFVGGGEERGYDVQSTAKERGKRPPQIFRVFFLWLRVTRKKISSGHLEKKIDFGWMEKKNKQNKQTIATPAGTR